MIASIGLLIVGQVVFGCLIGVSQINKERGY